MQIDAFMPAANGSVTVAVTASSQQLTIATATAGGNDVEINNTSANSVFVEQDPTNNNPTAIVATSYPILASQSKVIRLRSGVTKLAVIASVGGPSSVIFSIGDGI